MTTIYNDQDFLAVYKQRKTIKNIFIGVTAAVLAVCVTMLAYYMSLPYGDANQAIPKTVVYILTTAYILFLFPYMGIKYRRVNKYYKALSSFSQGLKLVERNYFYGFEEHSLQKDNIDVTYCIF